MRRFLWSFLEIAETVVIALGAVILIRTFVVQPFLVYGQSMEPTFDSGDYLLINELTYHFKAPQRGEVVVFKYPGDRTSYFIKRIIGLPGERVIIENNQVSIFSQGQQKLLHENYILSSTPGYYKITLGPNQYFVMGDNRNYSFDSRYWGPLDRSAIIGSVALRLWPITKVKAFAPPNY